MEQEKNVSLSFGERVKQLRKEKTTYSQEKFALHIGMDRSAYSKIEKGTADIRLSSMKRIAYGLGVSLSELVEGVPVDDVPLYEIIEINKESK